jgi:RNA polymerase sigma-70 factor (ECF subfamily)
MKDRPRAAIESSIAILVSHLDTSSLFRAHAPFVASFLSRLGVERVDLDDAVQEVFLVVHRKGGYHEGPAQPPTWLAEIALRVASQLRRTRRRRAWETDRESDERQDSRTPFEALDAAQSLERIQRAIDTLSLEQGAVFILYEIEGESCESIATGLAIPIGTVYSRLHAARRGFLRVYERLAADARRSSGPATRPAERGALS